MNFGRGFPIPQHGNRDSWSSVNQGMPIPLESGIGNSQDPRTTTMTGGNGIAGSGDTIVTPRRPIPMENGTPYTTMNPEQATLMGNEAGNNMNSWNRTMERTTLQGNRNLQNANNWKPLIPGNSIPQRNGVGQSRTSWTPVTPDKFMKERSNAVPLDIQQKQSETKNWQDLIGMYTGLLQDEKLDTNGVVGNINPTPPPMVQDNGNQNLFPSTTKRNLNPMPSPSPSPYRNHNSYQASTSLPFSNTNDPANCKSNHFETSVSNRQFIRNPPTRVEGNGMSSTSWTSKLESQQTQQFVSNLISNGHGPKSEFPVTYQARYSPVSPARSEPDAAASTVTDSFPFVPITPDNQGKHMDRQKVRENVNFPVEETLIPAKDAHENQTISIKDAENLYVNELNKTSQQKTPMRRKKHRPKVIREGKAKRTPKPKETRVKRKYVKKKGVNISETPQGDGIKEQIPVKSVGKRKYVRKKGVETPSKSCKKQLNFDFDLDRVAQDESHDIRSSQRDIHVDVNPQDIKQERRINGMPLGQARYHALNMLAKNMAMSPKHVQVGMVPANPKSVNQPSFLRTPQFLVGKGVVGLDEKRGVKRQNSDQMCHNANAMDSLLLYQKLLLGVAHRAYDRNNLNSIFLENNKKLKIQSITPLENNSRQMNGVYGNGSAMQFLNSCTGRINPAYKAMNFGGNFDNRQLRPPLAAAAHYLQKHQMSSGMQPHTMRSIPERSQKYGSGTALISWKASPYAVASPNSYSQRLNGLKSYLQTSMMEKGRARRQNPEVSVDVVTYMLKSLHIYVDKRKKKNELVMYKDSNAIVPFEPIKKRIPRPKVNLDPETDRVWRLLMGIEGSEGAEAADKDKEKWWENERRVFRGRADSFIARMHLVQGDRRFSRWKGSVVDSVIGVFLTQNVSDHLSSSAFMSLAAKFPVKSSTTEKTCCQEGHIEVAEPNDIIKECHENIIEQPVPDQEVILSQDSVDSSTIQTVDEIRSSSGSNSEAEDATTGFETSKENPTNLKDHSCHLPVEPESNMQIPRTNEVEPNSSLADLQKVELQSFGVVGGEIPINVEDRISMVDKQNCFENTATEANSKEQKASETGTNMSKARKGAAEDERNRTIDWDSLRKEALSNGEKRERSNDSADSLDYEELRCAHVNEISDAIKERGMNNLLADRMKDFLNRLVRDHGKIDLEWLRDAPPDKAKDYLLSFRGLGLKSVECVRLLTLHHLAFPVDTNVGRIAVRLGWVPLQPLPESLQLHLLEMYPVLETIQKYLWPRLCKMDQLTLYELHYQMITFGKVFCTKSKPNCNACPMRAECRHFASAFASARLALPGLEEKRIVTSDAPVATDPVPPVVIRPMPLPQAENEFEKIAGSFGRNCEPIVEEPTTPEPETTELSISDIEDQYYEDSDEIPSIKLNMEEFTTNLQNVMQVGKELQEDMSKALVALNPNAASIPTPKLKDVSRLRTKHLVYELPDSHRLLEGFNKREPDDPSPYLLAIWTPGETAHSVQPPEIECTAQESGKLCDRTTCFSCNSIKEANSQVVRGTILIPCRTAMKGSFPLNGTYFQVNEMFADHASSLNPIDVPRAWIWNLPRRTVYFGTSVSTIFKGLTTAGIQYCFWKGFVCVRGFERKTRAPRPLMARLHFPASKLVKTKNEGK